MIHIRILDCVAAIERLPALHYSVDFIFLPLGAWVSLWNFETIRGSLMKPKWQKLASLAQEICTLWFQFFGAVFASKGYPFKNIFDFTTAGDWDCVAAVERLPALHYSVDFVFLPLGAWVLLWNFETIRGSLMKPKWQKLASLAQEICTLWFQFFGAVFASKGYPFKNIFKREVGTGN